MSNYKEHYYIPIPVEQEQPEYPINIILIDGRLPMIANYYPDGRYMTMGRADAKEIKPTHFLKSVLGVPLKLLPKYKVDDEVFIIFRNKILAVIITNIVINLGTCNEGIKYTTKKKFNSNSWFDGGTYTEAELFETKEDLIKTL